MNTVKNGKGDSPRNNSSEAFRKRYDDIDWGDWSKQDHPCHKFYDTFGFPSSKQLVELLVTYTSDELFELTKTALQKDYEIRRKPLIDNKDK